MHIWSLSLANSKEKLRFLIAVTEIYSSTKLSTETTVNIDRSDYLQRFLYIHLSHYLLQLFL